ncbi:MAG: DNA alkylation repair protein [Aestuariivita sp.]|nr:DNA alkylation repair protein [Aestuariivita sp.]MCY4345161.1 DNA alkylation repair protein [Aestuariivita sp.]
MTETVAPYLAELEAKADVERAVEMARYHKVDRPYLGLRNGQIDQLTRSWQNRLSVADWSLVADSLWQTNIYECRLAASKLLTRPRITPDGKIWQLIISWTEDFDSWAIADHACMAGQKRLLADPSRLEDVELWVTSSKMWARRAALVVTLPWARMKNPEKGDIERRERILGWAEAYVSDHEWFIQKAIAWWLRDLSKRDSSCVEEFLRFHGDHMKPFARKEAAKYLSQAIF